jgi:transcriptional regulator
MLDGIVAFQLDVERLEGKFKLSQNRPAVDRKNVAAALAEGGEAAQQIARWMQRLVL